MYYPQNPFIQNPYQQNFYNQYPQQPQIQSQQPVYQRPMIYGRTVKSPDEITANEVSMDGTVSVFPMQDYSCIFAKAWNSDGTIKTVKFVPEVSTNDRPQENSLESLMNRRFDQLESLLTRKTEGDSK